MPLMTVPPDVKPGDQIESADENRVRAAIRAMQESNGQRGFYDDAGIHLRGGTGGAADRVGKGTRRGQFLGMLTDTKRGWMFVQATS